MENIKICPICFKAVPSNRRASYPSAVVCGRPKCSKEYQRREFNRHRTNYRRRKASDPAYRLREIQKRRGRYIVERLRLGKTPAARAPVAPERGAIDTFLAGIRRNVTGGLRRLGMRFRGVLRR